MKYLFMVLVLSTFMACKDSKAPAQEVVTSKEEMNSIVKEMEDLFRHSLNQVVVKTTNGCQYVSLTKKVYDLKSNSIKGDISFEKTLKETATVECGNIQLNKVATVTVITKKNPKEENYCLKTVTKTSSTYQIITCDGEKGNFDRVNKTLSMVSNGEGYTAEVIVKAQNFGFNELMTDLQKVDIEFLRYDEVNDAYIREREIKNTNAVTELQLAL